MPKLCLLLHVQLFGKSWRRVILIPCKSGLVAQASIVKDSKLVLKIVVKTLLHKYHNQVINRLALKNDLP